MNLPPEKILLRWMNFHLKKAGYKKIVTNFSSDVKVTEFFVIWWKVNVFIFYFLLWTIRNTVHSVLSQILMQNLCFVHFLWNNNLIIWSMKWRHSLVWSVVMFDCFWLQHFPNIYSTHVEYSSLFVQLKNNCQLTHLSQHLYTAWTLVPIPLFGYRH